MFFFFFFKSGRVFEMPLKQEAQGKGGARVQEGLYCDNAGTNGLASFWFAWFAMGIANSCVVLIVSFFGSLFWAV